MRLCRALAVFVSLVFMLGSAGFTVYAESWRSGAPVNAQAGNEWVRSNALSLLPGYFEIELRLQFTGGRDLTIHTGNMWVSEINPIVQVTTDFEPGYSLDDWVVQFTDNSGFGGDFAIGTPHRVTLDRMSSATPAYYYVQTAMPPFAFIDITDINTTESHATARFFSIQVGMEDLFDLNDFGVGDYRRAIVGLYNPNILTQHYRNIHIQNLRNNVPIYPLTVTIHPNPGAAAGGGAEYFTLVVPSSPAASPIYSYDTDFIGAPLVPLLDDPVAMMYNEDFYIAPKPNLPVGSYSNLVRLSQKGFCLTYHTHVAGLPNNMPYDPDPLLRHNAEFEVLFEVVRPATGVNVDVPTGAARYSTVDVDYSYRIVVPTPDSYSYYNGGALDFTYTIISNPANPQGDDIQITIPPPRYTFFDDSTPAALNGLPISVPIGFELLPARSVDGNGNLVFTIRPIEIQVPPSDYDVTFVLEGGFANSSPADVVVTITAGSQIGSANVPTPVRDNFRFDGWVLNNETQIRSNSNVAGLTVTGDMTFTAKWTPYHPVTFRFAGGNVGGNTNAITHYILENDPIGSANVPAPVRLGFHFAGWAQPGVAGAQSSNQVAGTIVDGPMSFTAQWSTSEITWTTPETPPQATPSPTPAPTPVPEDEDEDPDEDEDEYPDEPEPTPAPTEFHTNYVIGFADGTVRPNDTLTRAQAATIIFRLMSHEMREYYWSSDNPFADVGPNRWFNNAVSTVYNAGIMRGMPDGNFQPHRYISYAELIATIARFAGHEPYVNEAGTTGHWAEGYIYVAVQMGWILPGDFPESFLPNQPITRAETARLVNRKLNRLPGSADDLLNRTLVWSDNVNPGSWYFIHIQEASISHYTVRDYDGYEAWTGLADDLPWYRLERPGAAPGDIFGR